MILFILIFAHTKIASSEQFISNLESCQANLNCDFILKSSECKNKCEDFDEENCKNSKNKFYCEYYNGNCDSTFDCSTLNQNPEKCRNQEFCSYGDCILRGTFLQDKCYSLTKDICEQFNDQCKFKDSQFSYCSYKASQCASRDEINCDEKYCSKTPVVCESIIFYHTGFLHCNDINFNETCEVYKLFGCKWEVIANNTGGLCNDLCSQHSSEAQCKYQPYCQIKTNYQCMDNSLSGTDECQKSKDSQSCNIQFCSIGVTATQCNANESFCSIKNENDCKLNQNYCEYQENEKFLCSNKISQVTCKSFSTETQCQNQYGCSWNKPKCLNKESRKCDLTDSETICNSTGKYCNFFSQGVCQCTQFNTILYSFAYLILILAIL